MIRHWRHEWVYGGSWGLGYLGIKSNGLDKNRSKVFFRMSEILPMIRKSYKRSRGVTTVECAVTASLFLLLLLMVLDFSLYSFAKATMQHAVREGARYAITGQADLDPESEGSRKRAVIQKIQGNSMGFFDKIMTVSDIKVTDSDGSPVSGFGVPGESVVITLDCQWPILSPFTQAILSKTHYKFSVHTSMRNESFPGMST